jgi:hypothetical protein
VIRGVVEIRAIRGRAEPHVGGLWSIDDPAPDVRHTVPIAVAEDEDPTAVARCGYEHIAVRRHGEMAGPAE